jgi:hypothetical protein
VVQGSPEQVQPERGDVGRGVAGCPKLAIEPFRLPWRGQPRELLQREKSGCASHALHILEGIAAEGRNWIDRVPPAATDNSLAQ